MTVEIFGPMLDELNPEIMRVVFKDSGFKDIESVYNSQFSGMTKAEGSVL